MVKVNHIAKDYTEAGSMNSLIGLWGFLSEGDQDSIFLTKGGEVGVVIRVAGVDDEVEINVKNVSIEDLRTSPYKATVDFEKIYYGSGERTESKREKYSAHFVFVVKERVPSAWIPINPLGLTITYSVRTRLSNRCAYDYQRVLRHHDHLHGYRVLVWSNNSCGQAIEFE